MRIIVCVKQVPAIADIKINPETKTLNRTGLPSRINSYDEYAIEEALRVKEKFGGHITAISMGPPQAEEILVRCLALGVDESILLTDPLLIGSDTLATSYALSQLISQVGFDLIFCGQETTDSSTAQVGPEIAEHLNIPQLTFVRKIERIEKCEIVVHRETDYGFQVIQSSLPALLTVTKRINEPRCICLPKVRKAVKRIAVEDLNCDSKLLGIEGSPTRVLKIAPSLPKGDVILIPANLPARRRIELIMSGGLREREDKVFMHGADYKIARTVVLMLKNSD